jgi:polyisoprenoid-binding protein YceI
MKKILVLISAAMVAFASFGQTKWDLDKAHSKVGFSVVHMAVTETEGYFKDFDVKVSSTSDDFNGATVEFTAQVASINTDNERRDDHLKSDDFFNAEKFPTVTFKGKIVKEGVKYLLKGDFTMRDVTKSVTFELKYGGTVDTGRGVKAGFKVTGVINRQEYGLKWANKLASGEMVVADDVEIICKIELNKAA